MPSTPDVATAPLRRLRPSQAEPDEKALARLIWVLNEVFRRITRHAWQGQDKVPPTGGAVFAVNHISNLDPIVFGQFLAYAGRYPHYLGKASLFRVPVMGRIITACGQIPVERGSVNAVQALSSAIEAVRQGKTVTVYPEGTITLDPALWPMAGKTGAARIALETRAPVIPAATWGGQEILGAKKMHRPKLWPRRTMRVAAGDPVDLDDLRSVPITPAVLREATNRIMAAITALVAQLRGEDPPERGLDPRSAAKPPESR
ncbi:MAG TPA: lysophospholipid acyltransferase family protein [Propionibacteriaceae bacterium]